MDGLLPIAFLVLWLLHLQRKARQSYRAKFVKARNTSVSQTSRQTYNPQSYYYVQLCICDEKECFSLVAKLVGTLLGGSTFLRNARYTEIFG